MPEAPMPPGQPAAQPQAPAEGGGEGGGITELIVSTDAGLAKLAAGVAESGAPDELKAGIAQISEAYRAWVEQARASAGGGDAPQAPGGPSTPEQGGNPNARPQTMGG